jgi:glycosyltransferase involved in cell wall biosynthesis
MKKEITPFNKHDNEYTTPVKLQDSNKTTGIININGKSANFTNDGNDLAEILVVSSYPPRKCGIATYSEDLTRSLNLKFKDSFSLRICALEAGFPKHNYPDEVKYVFDTTSRYPAYHNLSRSINADSKIKIVLIQHEFGLFHRREEEFLQFINEIEVPVIIVFHTVIPDPGEQLKMVVRQISGAVDSIIVMTDDSARVLNEKYSIDSNKVTVIPHGTHLITYSNKDSLKAKHDLHGRKVLTTFGLLGPGKRIETTLEALPSIIKLHPDVMFLAIGKTHPEIIKNEGEKYRTMLHEMVREKNLGKHVRFIDSYVPLALLLEYLQLTDIYLFTSSDPNQAVSGTFVYAMSCGCPIISTPIPHARELLSEETGRFFDYLNSKQLAGSVIELLSDERLRETLGLNALHMIAPTAWENSAIAHARLFTSTADRSIKLQYNPPPVKLDHLRRLTTGKGIIRYSYVNEPDISSGYTLDDNARALVAACMYFNLTGDKQVIPDIRKYLAFMRLCQQPGGNFLNYADRDGNFTPENYSSPLDDVNGRAVWALGHLISLNGSLPAELIFDAITVIEKALDHMMTVKSPVAMAFAVKGLYYYQRAYKNSTIIDRVEVFASRLAGLYKQESDAGWDWFGSYLTYANSILPAAMLYSWVLTGNRFYKDCAVSTLDFLVSKTFTENGIEVISNRGGLKHGHKSPLSGQQPFEVACTVMTLSKFYEAFNERKYFDRMITAFNWFLGENRLRQIIYNPVTGGCYDALEKNHVNLNQGAESVVSYLIARLTVGKYKHEQQAMHVRNILSAGT